MSQEVASHRNLIRWHLDLGIASLLREKPRSWCVSLSQSRLREGAKETLPVTLNYLCTKHTEDTKMATPIFALRPSMRA